MIILKKSQEFLDFDGQLLGWSQKCSYGLHDLLSGFCIYEFGGCLQFL